MEYKRLYKSSTDKAIFGVCGGFAEYFEIDSLIIRLVLVLFTLAFGAGLLFYIIAALIMPKRPEDGGDPVQPAQPGAYNAGGSTYVNRASYAEPAPQDVTRTAPVPQETAAQENPQASECTDFVLVDSPEQDATAEDAPKEEPVKEEAPKQEPKPERPYQAYNTYQEPPRQQFAKQPQPVRSSGDKTRLLLGVILILIGLFVLVRVFLPRFDTRILFAACVIIAGAFLILKRD